MTFDPDAYLAEDHTKAFDPDEHLTTPDQPESPYRNGVQPNGVIILDGRVIMPKSNDTAWKAADSVIMKQLSGAGSAIIGGYKGLASLAIGHSPEEAANEVTDYQRTHTIAPSGNTKAVKANNAVESVYNPLTWPSRIGEFAGSKTSEGLHALGASPEAAGLAGATVNTGINAIPMILGLKKGGAKTVAEEPEFSSTQPPNAADFNATEQGSHAFSASTAAQPPKEGGVSPDLHAERAEILKRVGIENARNSAITGDAKAAATDFQLSKFDEPAGQAAKAQFDAERTALTNHAAKIVENTGGTIGLDEDALNARGQTIASFPDALRQYFKDQRGKLYEAANERSGGQPVTDLGEVDALLKEPKFRNALLAKDQGGLLNAVESQLQNFRESNPQGFSVQSAEQVRQWLNQIWTPQNSQIIGQLKGAIDESVLKGAGEDLYGPAREMVKLEKATLDNPKGASKLFETDPQTPVNRATPYEKIPDSLIKLPHDQFNHIVEMYKNAPEELKPQAEAGLAEMKAQLANKILDAGSSTQGQWNAPKVSQVLKANSAKFKALFTPEEIAQFSDLDAAGKILKVDQSYPGAAAQAANALKRGLMSRAIQKVSGMVGAGAGSTMGAPAIGAAAGEVVGNSLGQSVGESAALKNWKGRTTKLSDVMKTTSTKK